MSIAFKISGKNFNKSAWQGRLRALLKGEVGWKPLPCMRQILLAQAGASDMDGIPMDQKELLLLGESSTRGVQVSQGQDVTVELPLMASEVDWVIARYLLFASNGPGVVITDGETGGQLTDADLEVQAFSAKATRLRNLDFRMARGIGEKDGSGLKFPVAHFELSLSKDDVRTLDERECYARLMQQCHTFGSAFIATTMKAQRQDGSSFLLAAHTGIPTLFRADVDGVMFGAPEGLFRYSDSPIPLDHVRRVLQRFLVPTGSWLYLPAIPWQDEAALLQELVGRTSEELLQAIQSQLAQRVVKSLVLVFVALTPSENAQDEKHWHRFSALLQEAAPRQEDKNCFAEAARRVLADGRSLLKALTQVPFDPRIEFRCISMALDQTLPPDAAANFKTRLYTLAEKLAETPKTGFFSFGSRISSRNQAVLKVMKQCLAA